MHDSSLGRALAWAVHLFTATGAVCGLFALDAISRGQARAALAWMLAAVVVDAVDGVLARAVRVDQATPGYDGALLDNLIDYLNYAVVPAFFVLRLAVVPPRFSGYAAIAIVLAAAYQFAQRDAKTADHYFRGFPSYWNVAVFYLYFLGLSPFRNLGIVLLLLVLTFVPQKWVYPTRMSRLRRTTLLLASVWGATIAYALTKVPTPVDLIWASLLFVGYYVGVSLFLARTR
ncbi:MAG: hypothetical protein GKS06_03400 [Acidobacteria bacterium]|nr:hypothetical protein [Acidobacteriota bacterium]